MAGVKGIRAKKEESFFRRLFSRIRVLECNLKAIKWSSDIVVKLAMIGTRDNALDVLTAGIALANGAEKIVTKDKHFIEIGKIADIKVITYWRPDIILTNTKSYYRDRNILSLALALPRTLENALTHFPRSNKIENIAYF